MDVRLMLCYFRALYYKAYNLTRKYKVITWEISSDYHGGVMLFQYQEHYRSLHNGKDTAVIRGRGFSTGKYSGVRLPRHPTGVLIF